ncbi:bifunctional (p)ppGpp synthetase/guanosine-3',5'-bis(diphosphate) 3'-pyrophosphohydrolase [Candidatus Uhrbacteria bacterium]|nr:bifunctional (p)ppGpp synthetase/guanosine-3',5'-bis(diphosphate) 3'-pyrophosphohydrolase [Candidatus Uhrbacteria bacterium]
MFPLPNNFNVFDVQRQRLIAALASFPKSSKTEILKGLSLTERAHAGQYRDDGAPYAIHPIRMAVSLIKDFNITSPTLVIAALLHDVVEDTTVTLAAIQKACGKTVASLVNDVTDARPPRETETQKRKRKQQKLIALLEKRKSSRIVKCADILDNIRSWPLVTDKSSAFHKLTRWVEEARAHSLPFAKATDEKMYRLIKRTLDAYERPHTKNS